MLVRYKNKLVLDTVVNLKRKDILAVSRLLDLVLKYIAFITQLQIT